MKNDDIKLLEEAYSSMYNNRETLYDVLSLVKDQDWGFGSDVYIGVAEYIDKHSFDKDELENDLQILRNAQKAGPEEIENIYGPGNDFLLDIEVSLLKDYIFGNLENQEKSYHQQTG
jgi:hypothetical protein